MRKFLPSILVGYIVDSGGVLSIPERYKIILSPVGWARGKYVPMIINTDCVLVF